MAGIDVTQVLASLGKHIVGSEHEIRQWAYRESELGKYTDRLVRIDGIFPAFHDVMGHVVQEFKAVWNALGTNKFKVNKLETFKQKVNYLFTAADVVGSWLAYLAAENLKAEQMPIGRWLLNNLAAKVQDDVAILEGTGTYTADTGAFGDSMDGIITVLENKLATGNPFLVPLTTLTPANIVAQVTRFERMVPIKIWAKTDKLFMSQENADLYAMNYEDTFGTKVTYTEDGKMKSRLRKKQIVGLECMNGSDLIFSTPKKNFLQLVDINDPGKITDVQKDDYDVKIFMEFSLGYNFWMDEALCISDFGGLARGLATDHALYYPEISTTPIA